jgi:pyruvate dehydrogenase E2 component (dihydrolipoamide acetyltransferase)
MSTQTLHAVTMPKWGLEMMEGTIAAWKLAVGATVAKGAELADIETAKIVNTIESEGEGTLRKQVAAQGETLPVGALIAVIGAASVSDAEVERFVKEYKPLVPTGDEPMEAAPVAAAATSAPAQVVAVAPSSLSAADLEKRNADAHATPIARRVANKLGIDLTTITGTGPKGRISQEDVERAAGSGGSAPAAAARVPAAPAEPPPRPADLEQRNATAYASPIALRVANKLGVDLTKVAGTGSKGRISQEDVEKAAAAQGLSAPPTTAPAPAAAPVAAPAAPAPAAPPPQGSELIPHSAMRKTIAAALVRAKQTIPHFYLTADLQMDALLNLRRDLNAERAEKLSVNDFFMRAVALALVKSPNVNVQYAEDGIRRFSNVDVCVAVAIDGGLITPVLRDASSKNLSQISCETADLAKRARARTLRAEELSGGTFTVSNLGMFGIRQFEAIINPPQGAILAVGNVRREAYEAEGGGVAFRSVTSVTLSCDHRAIDGALGAAFLAELRKLIERPVSLLGAV